MDARTYLIGKGLAKPGRGRFSTAAKIELERAAREDGIKFGNVTVVTGDSGIKVNSKTEPEDIEPAPMLWPNHIALDSDGVEISMSNACQGCGWSLNWCSCPQPRAIGSNNHYQGVYIVPKS